MMGPETTMTPRTTDMKLSSEVRKLQETSKDLFPCGSRSWEWEYFDGRCYYFSVEKATWHMARSQCQAKNSDLVVIHHDAEQNFLQYQARNMLFWIGLHDLKEEGYWTWVDATDYRTGFMKWNRGEPNDSQGKEDCAMISETGRWNDMPCTSSAMYVCEKPLPS
ncbi:hepatic lectin-like isoform X2 [Hemicordylus capensis]|uniref:hepatic lectin-like isoform X2 n=1 Tax=Hemicordylus capensis TaxID=884348 RepID=UPI0023022B76|nr:hepatic lectin-like isoform X2 [Hemicordylus capensis]